MKITTLFVGAGLLSASIISCQKEEIAASEAMPSIQYAVNGDSTVVKTTSSSETKLRLSQVPVSILRFLAKNYPNNVFVGASKSVNPNNVTTYKVKVKVGTTPYELKFDDKGALIQKSQDGVGSNKIAEAELLPAIKEYIKANFAGFIYVSGEKYVKASETSFEIKIKSATGLIVDLKFDAKGVFKSSSSSKGVGSSLKDSDLLAAIREYLKATYPGYTFVKAEKYEKSKVVSFEVKIKTADGKTVELKFDANGKLVSPTPSTNGVTVLKELELSAAIRNYLKSTYAGYTFVKAERYDKANVVSIEVSIKTKDGKTVELKFDANGKLVSPTPSTNGVTVLKEADLPEAIKTYLKTKYTSYTFVSAKKVVSNNDTNYLVSIKTGATNVELKFNSKGEIISPAGTTTNNEISADKLLPAIKTYLEVNFKGYTFVNALKITADKVDYYFVNFKLANVTYQIKFDAKGVFMSYSNSNKEEVSLIKPDQLLSVIREYLSKNYKNYTFVQAKKISKAGTITYQVMISVSDKYYVMVFDAKGKFLELKK